MRIGEMKRGMQINHVHGDKGANPLEADGAVLPEGSCFACEEIKEAHDRMDRSKEA